MTHPLKLIKNQEPWYSQGLSFQCTGCGKCCTGFPGYVWLEEEEIVRIAQFLNLTVEDFANKYLRVVNNRVSLRENAGNFDCVFFKDKQCSVYKVRPTQCRTYPFWKQNLTSKETWEQVATECEGVRDHYPKISKEIIEQNLHAT
ncbi:hypothetical protein PHSC3_001877 [Chlamydiales bacterium STE3]|nr:hypothetical protein PHSC3_001877 [Chlamydiales bacterium STE3]